MVEDGGQNWGFIEQIVDEDLFHADIGEDGEHFGEDRISLGMIKTEEAGEGRHQMFFNDVFVDIVVLIGVLIAGDIESEYYIEDLQVLQEFLSQNLISFLLLQR